jgi:hypothetical protein
MGALPNDFAAPTRAEKRAAGAQKKSLIARAVGQKNPAHA